MLDPGEITRSVSRLPILCLGSGVYEIASGARGRGFESRRAIHRNSHPRWGSRSRGTLFWDGSSGFMTFFMTNPSCWPWLSGQAGGPASGGVETASNYPTAEFTGGRP